MATNVNLTRPLSTVGVAPSAPTVSAARSLAPTATSTDPGVFSVSPLPTGSKDLGAAPATQAAQVTFVLPRNNEAQFQSQLQTIEQTHQFMTAQEYAQSFGAKPDDIAAVQAFAKASGMTVQKIDPVTRLVTLSGTVANVNAAFGANMHNFQVKGSPAFPSPAGTLALPPALQGHVQDVFGLDGAPMPMAKPDLRKPDPTKPAAGETSFNPTDVAKLYNFPTGGAAGQTIGLIELGGGVSQTDLQTYFKGLGMKTPDDTTVNIDGADTTPGKDTDSDGEVMLDNEVAGAMAPGAKIVNYFAPNTNAGFLDAIESAVHDTTHAPSVLSISWGGPESSWTAEDMESFDEAFQEAAALGITVTAAAGDNGSSDGATTHNKLNVDFPGTSPYVLDVGGTSLQASNGKISKETVWNDNPGSSATGGGISTQFGVPTWQQGLHATTSNGKSELLPMRGAPDVASDADPNTGYNVLVDGQQQVIGGTSSGAPAWAALIALANAQNGKRSGDIHQILYSNPQDFHDITQGNNGGFEATSGWDATTGLGTPDGEAITKPLAGA